MAATVSPSLHLIPGMQADPLQLAGDRGRDGEDLSDLRLALFLDRNLQRAGGDFGQFHSDRAGDKGPDQEGDHGQGGCGRDEAAHGSLPCLQDFDHVEIVDPAPDQRRRKPEQQAQVTRLAVAKTSRPMTKGTR